MRVTDSNKVCIKKESAKSDERHACTQTSQGTACAHTKRLPMRRINASAETGLTMNIEKIRYNAQERNAFLATLATKNRRKIGAIVRDVRRAIFDLDDAMQALPRRGTDRNA